MLGGDEVDIQPDPELSFFASKGFIQQFLDLITLFQTVLPGSVYVLSHSTLSSFKRPWLWFLVCRVFLWKVFKVIRPLTHFLLLQV